METPGLTLLTLGLQWLRQESTLWIRVVDSQGVPLPHVPVRLTRSQPRDPDVVVVAEGMTDSSGRVTLEGVPFGGYSVGSQETLGPLRSLRWVDVEWPEHHWTLTMGAICPGSFAIRDERGRLVPGAFFQIAWHLPTTAADETGRVFVSDRPCGPLQVRAGLPQETLQEAQSVWVEGSVEFDVPLRSLEAHTATLLAVTPDGAPAEVTATSATRFKSDFEVIEALGGGRFTVSSPYPTMAVSLAGYGSFEQTARFPLDGGEHVVVLESTRSVAVTLLCRDAAWCPDTVSCGTETCLGAAPNFNCVCPPGDTRIRHWQEAFNSYRDIGVVPANDDAVTLDMRLNSRFRGRWIGDLPCTYSVQELSRTTSVSPQCSHDGSFGGTMNSGAHEVVVWHGDQRASLLVIANGTEIDLGDIGPDNVEPIPVMLDADFSLAGSTLYAQPGLVERQQDDAYLLTPASGANTVLLTLGTWGDGRFDVRLPLTEGPLLWTIRASDVWDTHPLEDTGISSDTGLWEDSGVSWHDTDGWDTGAGAHSEHTGGYDSEAW